MKTEAVTLQMLQLGLVRFGAALPSYDLALDRTYHKNLFDLVESATLFTTALKDRLPQTGEFLDSDGAIGQSFRDLSARLTAPGVSATADRAHLLAHLTQLHWAIIHHDASAFPSPAYDDSRRPLMPATPPEPLDGAFAA